MMRRTTTGWITLILCATLAGSPAWAGEAPPPLDPHFATFWSAFSRAVISSDTSAVANMVRFPLDITIDNHQITSKKLFLKDFNRLFPARQKRCFRSTQPMAGDDCDDCYILYCHDRYYGFEQTGHTFTLFTIGQND